MRISAFAVLALPFMVAPAAAQTKMQDQSFRQEWLLCQSGDVQRCKRLLKLPLDDETRVLVEADLQQAQERLHAQVQALLQLCNQKDNVRACDRALRYDLPATDRNEILGVRKTVIQRSSQRGDR